MTRATEAFTALSVVAAIYFTLLLGILPLPSIIQDKIVPVFPWWALVSFGSYSLGNLGWHIMNFSDCPEAYHELMTQVHEAKADLRKQGVTI